jgi:protein CWC15
METKMRRLPSDVKFWRRRGILMQNLRRMIRTGITFIDKPNFSDSSESEDEDDTAALMAELAKIKAERASERARQDAEADAKDRDEKDHAMATGNPLLNSGTKDFNIKRRWDDDVIFKNQARGVDDKPKNRFVNDMLRSDFHKKFLNKYVK